jgi:ribonuclease D
MPRDAAALSALVPDKFVARNGAAVLAAVAAHAEPGLQAEVRANASQAAPDKNVVKALQERVRQHAAKLGIEPEILATRRDLVAAAAGRPPAHLTQGWRAAELAALLAPDTAPAT